MADTTIDLLKNSSYVGKMDELIAAVKSGGGTASDVEWNNVKNKPTTIGGYGITDAKIDNGTITLGNQTITPLTSAPVTSVNSQTGAVVLTANDVSAIPSTLTGTVGQVLTKTADGQEWKDVEIPSGTNDHSKLINRDAADQHPIGAITGLEAALANIPPTDAFIVTLTINEGGTKSVDKTFAEIQAALQSNRTVYLYAQGMMMFLPLVLRSPDNNVVFGFAYANQTGIASLLIVISNDNQIDMLNNTIKKLPNPNALTFTGAVTGSYDGSAPLSVEIPAGGGTVEDLPVLQSFTIEDDQTNIIEFTNLQNLTEFEVEISWTWSSTTGVSGIALWLKAGFVVWRDQTPILNNGMNRNMTSKIVFKGKRLSNTVNNIAIIGGVTGSYSSSCVTRISESETVDYIGLKLTTSDVFFVNGTTVILRGR